LSGGSAREAGFDPALLTRFARGAVQPTALFADMQNSVRWAGLAPAAVVAVVAASVVDIVVEIHRDPFVESSEGSRATFPATRPTVVPWDAAEREFAVPEGIDLEGIDLEDIVPEDIVLEGIVLVDTAQAGTAYQAVEV
jgi:hypothetical protein